jgi:hypothetical protein
MIVTIKRSSRQRAKEREKRRLLVVKRGEEAERKSLLSKIAG